MSLFDSRQIDGDGEGLELLASVLHQTKRGRAKALARGRCRAAQSAKGIDVWIQRPLREGRGIDGDVLLA